LAGAGAEPRAALERMFRTVLPGVALYLAALFAAVDIFWKGMLPW